MRRTLAGLALIGAALLAAGPAAAQDAGANGDKNPFDSADDPGGPSDPGAKDQSTPLYLKALELQRKGKWKEAQAAFRELLKKFPESCHKYDCEQRGGDNCYLGTVKLHESGPCSRRIDVAVMGDGFQLEASAQKLEQEWAKLCLDVLFSEATYSEYRDYFNYYYVRLVSKDDGVDKTETEAERIKREERNRRKAKKKAAPQDFNTALDAKAAGPQGQVVMDRDLVYHWLGYANSEVPGCGDDALVIAFAKFGSLGMGGGGIANVGRPDKSITVHEFGHAFVGLDDEYANHPGPPLHAVRSPNSTSDPKHIPWQHFLDKKVDGVGIYEGGATYVKGVWRPAIGCAMNSAGNTGGYCPVCKEATILRIYSYLGPIDTAHPSMDVEQRCVAGDGTTLQVVPMRPRGHDVDVHWYFERVQDSEPGPQKIDAGATSDMPATMDGWDPGPRQRGRNPAQFELPPPGFPVPDDDPLVKREKDKSGRISKHLFDVSGLPRGRYLVTADVRDPCKYVLKDDQHLLEERAQWWVTVQPGGKKR